MIQRLRWAVDMAEAIGQRDQAEEWRRTADLMSDAFSLYHVVAPNGFLPAHVDDVLGPDDPAAERGFSQAAQAAAAASGFPVQAGLDYAFALPDGSPPQDKALRRHGVAGDVTQAPGPRRNAQPGAGAPNSHAEQGIVQPEQWRRLPAVRTGLIGRLRRIDIAFIQSQVFPAHPVFREGTSVGPCSSGGTRLRGFPGRYLA